MVIEMSEWISVGNRLPELGQQVWIAKDWKAAWKPRTAIWKRDGGLPAFFPGDGCAYLPGEKGHYRVSHWAPEHPATVVSSSPEECDGEAKRTRTYNMTPEGLAAKKEKMREYWRKRKAADAKNNDD